MARARAWGAVMVENTRVVDARVYATDAARHNAASAWAARAGRLVVLFRRGTSRKRGGSWLPEDRVYEGGGEQVRFPMSPAERQATRRAYEGALVTVAKGGKLPTHNELPRNRCRPTKSGVTCNVDGKTRRFKLAGSRRETVGRHGRGDTAFPWYVRGARKRKPKLDKLQSVAVFFVGQFVNEVAYFVKGGDPGDAARIWSFHHGEVQAPSAIILVWKGGEWAPGAYAGPGDGRLTTTLTDDQFDGARMVERSWRDLGSTERRVATTSPLSQLASMWRETLARKQRSADQERNARSASLEVVKVLEHLKREDSDNLPNIAHVARMDGSETARVLLFLSDEGYVTASQASGGRRYKLTEAGARYLGEQTGRKIPAKNATPKPKPQPSAKPAPRRAPTEPAQPTLFGRSKTKWGKSSSSKALADVRKRSGLSGARLRADHTASQWRWRVS